MSPERATYLDSSAVVKLVVREPESTALRRYLRKKSPIVSSALVRTEVLRALASFDARSIERARLVLGHLEIMRINDRILNAAGVLAPPMLRTLDAIHLATMIEMGDEAVRIVTYDERMAAAALSLNLTVVTPS